MGDRELRDALEAAHAELDEARQRAERAEDEARTLEGALRRLGQLRTNDAPAPVEPDEPGRSEGIVLPIIGVLLLVLGVIGFASGTSDLGHLCDASMAVGWGLFALVPTLLEHFS